MGRCIVSFSRCCRSHAPMSGGLRAPRSPLRQGCQTLHLLRTATPSSLGSTDGVEHYMTTVASFVAGNTIYVAFFYPIRLPSLDSGRLFSAKTAFRDKPCATLQSGRFCGTFFAAPAQPFMAAQVFARSRPARGCAPLDPRQGAPCTCPSPPFTAAQGLCFTRNFAEETNVGPEMETTDHLSPVAIYTLVTASSRSPCPTCRRSSPGSPCRTRCSDSGG